MLALGLFAVGVSGIIAMQKVTLVSNQHAKNLAIATRVAEAWLDQLAADATLWDSTLGIDATLWVINAKDADGLWQLPPWDGQRQFGPGFDALGAPIADGDNARFCTHVRLTSLFDQAGGESISGRQTLAGNGLARAEVRVFWLRDGAAPIDGACSNNDSGTIADVAAATDRYHQVFKVSAVRQHWMPR
jgi:type IV pilus assembly protein PilV